MRRVAILSALLFCAVVTPVFSQTPDSVIESRMTRRALSCGDILLNATTLLPRYVQAGADDSVQALLDFSDRRCDFILPLFHFRLLYAVDTGIVDSLIDPSIWYRLKSYRVENTDADEAEAYRYYRGFVDDSFHSFLRDYGMHLARRGNARSPSSQWIAEFFAADGYESAIPSLDTSWLAGTRLQRYMRHFQRRERFYENNRFFWAVGAGVWLPQGALQTLGDHPTIGGEIGVINGRWTFAVPLSIHFLNSRDSYQMWFRDSLYTTNNFFGAHIGARADYAFWKADKTEMAVSGGFGYEGFEVVADGTPNDNNDDSKGLGTLNLNAGFSARYYLNSPFLGNTMFVALSLRHNWLSYKNPGATDLSGNAWTVGVSIGGGRWPAKAGKPDQ